MSPLDRHMEQEIPNQFRQVNIEQYKAKVNGYEEQIFSLEKAIHLAANDDSPYLHKRLRLEDAQFLIIFSSPEPLAHGEL